MGQINLNRLYEVMASINDDLIVESYGDINEAHKKADRCLRIARKRYDKPSAYRSGAIVRCRQGKIWKDLKEEDINEAPEDIKDLLYKAHESITELKGSDYAPNINELEDWVQNHINNDIEEAKKKGKTDYSKEKKDGLHGWFSRRGGGGNKGWVDCNTCRTVDGKKKCKACGREKGEKRAKYPSCRPTPSACGTPGKGKKWGKTKKVNEETNRIKQIMGLITEKEEKLHHTGVFRENDEIKYPIEKKGVWYGDEDYENRGGKLVYMSPDEFLSKAKPLEIDDETQENVNDLISHIKSGGKLDPLSLYSIDRSDVKASDGRHRAIAAKQLNITKVPVLDFTNNDLNEAIVGDKIECDNCDWSWDIKDGGDDLYVCHKCWYDNTPTIKESFVLKNL